MRLLLVRLLCSSSLLLLVAACAGPAATAVVPPAGSAPQAVDLGGSNRIARIAGAPGEGEGYDAVKSAQMSMPGMTHPASMPMATASAPAVDHAAMGHGAMGASAASQGTVDHSKMDHGSPPGTRQAPAAVPQVAQAAHVQGSGTVNSVDAAGHKVNLNHNPIPAIGWPAMIMDFAVAPSVDLRALKPGTRVDFMMQRGGDGMYVIHSITPAGGQR